VHPSVPHYVFLIGTAVRKREALEYRPFTADSDKDVPRVAKEFLNFLDGLGDYQVYYWSKKEDDEFQKIFNTYKISGPSVDRFNAQKLDLSKTIHERVYFPIPRYSVKEIGTFLGYQRKEQEVDATEAGNAGSGSSRQDSQL